METDLCSNQPLSIVHEIYESFDNFPSLEMPLKFWMYQKLLKGFGMKV